MEPHFKSKIPTVRTETQSHPSKKAVPIPGDLPRHLGKLDVRLGMIDRYHLRRGVSTEMREKLAEIASMALEKQRAEIQHQLMLDLDVKKKELFQDYMEHVSILNKDLIEKSNAMERNLREMLWHEVESIYQEKRNWEERMSGWPLTDDERRAESKSLDEWIVFARGQVEGKLSTLIETHSASLKVTLELLRDTAIRDDAGTRGIS